MNKYFKEQREMTDEDDGDTASGLVDIAAGKS